MTQKLDEQTRLTVDRARSHPIFENIRAKKFDKAWDAIQSDRELDGVRNKMSLHELRRIIQHVAEAFDI